MLLTEQVLRQAVRQYTDQYVPAYEAGLITEAELQEGILSGIKGLFSQGSAARQAGASVGQAVKQAGQAVAQAGQAVGQKAGQAAQAVAQGAARVKQDFQVGSAQGDIASIQAKLAAITTKYKAEKADFQAANKQAYQKIAQTLGLTLNPSDPMFANKVEKAMANRAQLNEVALDEMCKTLDENTAKPVVTERPKLKLLPAHLRPSANKAVGIGK